MAETTPYTKQTWTDGVSSASAARFTVIEEGVRAAHEQPAARVTHNTTQAITTATETTLAFNTERIDQAFGSASTIHDNVTNNSRLTCRHAGVYQISCHIEFQGNSTGVRYLTVRYGGATTIAIQRAIVTGDGTAWPISISTLYALAVNDYVEARVYQNSGGSLNILNTANYSPEFMMVRVG